MADSPRTSVAPLTPCELERLTAGGTTGNERLTAVTGAGPDRAAGGDRRDDHLAAQLLWVHLFVGMLLIGPVALKLASTGYRFVRYYTRRPALPARGAPTDALLRVIAPMVVLTTVVVFASGVALLFAGPQSRQTLLPIHKVSFFVWVAFTAIHVLGHLPGDPTSAARATTGHPHRGAQGRTPGGPGGPSALASALTAGVVLAVLVIPEFGPWLHASFHHHH